MIKYITLENDPKPLPYFTFPDEFCDGFPHNLLPTPGYWIECSRAISNQGSAWTNEERDLQEIDEGINIFNTFKVFFCIFL